jgi:Fic family protein
MAKQADTDAPYAPPLTLNPALLNRVAAIAEALGRWSARQDSQPSPRLRRENRIQTIQASLAIEQNSLSLEQVSALFDGQRVIGPARDIQEVRNAIAAYDALPRWDLSNPQHLLEAHGLLMAGLVDDLLAWLDASTWHPLVVSCVAHYELEFIHPFADRGSDPLPAAGLLRIAGPGGSAGRSGALRYLPTGSHPRCPAFGDRFGDEFG